MEILQNYKKYKSHTGEYTDWKANRDLLDAQRQALTTKSPSDEKTQKEDIQRGRTLLRAIDIMDEYSQSRAEDTEVATDMIVGQAVGFTSMIGSGLGAALMFTKPIQKRLDAAVKKTPKAEVFIKLAPVLLGLLAGMLPFIPLSSWAAKMQVKASRQGRFDAMKKDLSDPKSFAILTDEQTKQALEAAEKMPNKEKKKSFFDDVKGPIKMFKNLFSKNKEFEAEKVDFDKKLVEHEKNFDKTLTPEQILNAQKDKQALSKIVEKIDIASQDYAENIELATNTLTTVGIGTGLLTGLLAKGVLKLLKVKNNEISNMISGGTTLLFTLGAAIASAKIQKQGSRVGRFKVKQELSNNPQALIYADDKQASELKDVKAPEQKKKTSLLKFLKQAFKDNKEYNKYLKTQGKNEKKFEKALKEIQLTDEQMQHAKVLQRNTFKTFNKVDEKSQTYSESVEALGEIVKQPIGIIGELAGGMVAASMAFKSKGKKADLDKLAALPINMITGMFVGLLPAIGFDVYITKEQKKASRIADMLALKELDDVRHYADYDSVSTSGQKPVKPADEAQQTVKQNKNTFNKFL